MSILELAHKLQAVEVIHVHKHNKQLFKTSQQLFDYILVLDFEATCWDKNEKKSAGFEIIEFPCVLFDVKEKIIVAEFQQYVMPTENIKLSPFCTNLTGITQEKVDNGVPLGTCLMLFQKWLREQTNLFKLDLERCPIATWSDWDLGICLRKECQRKNLNRSSIFTRWIDVRLLYKEHYHRAPRGLMNSLMERGIDFEGRQHCGLHDARNTARLIGKMISDGCMLRITSPRHVGS